MFSLDTREEARETDVLAAEIARELGEEWAVVRRDSIYTAAELTGRFGKRLLVRADRNNRKRVEIVGAYPAHHVYGLRSPVIGVTATRGALAIAGEIRRRLMPEYVAGLKEIEARSAARQAAHHKRKVAAVDFSSRMADGRIRDDEHSASTSVDGRTADGVHLAVRVFEERADIEITGASHEQIRAILATLPVR